jgi:hypothetical protein
MMHEARRLPCILVALAISVAWGCGGGGGNRGEPDADTDVPDDPVTDVDTDAGDAPSDTGTDAGDAVHDVTDVEEEDVTVHRTMHPFMTETSGGGRMTSPGYRLELFIGPVRPVGLCASDNYSVKLGPASVRGH